jgi:hypothetical protein
VSKLFQTRCACGRRWIDCNGQHTECKQPMLSATDRATGRTYFDSRTTSYGMLVGSLACEHCDGERQRLVRNDHLRGWVCPPCDSSLDEMLQEGACVP